MEGIIDKNSSVSLKTIKIIHLLVMIPYQMEEYLIYKEGGAVIFNLLVMY